MRLSLGLSGEDVRPELASALDGVGLIRGEYVFRRLRQFVTVPAAARWLTAYLERVAACFAPAPVWYRTNDLEAREVSILEGCDDHVDDRVAMLGTRGVRRAILHPDVFDLELAAFEQAAREHPNLGLLFPYVAEPPELRWAVDRARMNGITAPLGCMAEIPAAVIGLDDLLDTGVGRVVVGCNDLGALTMGVARGSTRYPPLSSGLERMIAMARTITATRGVELALAGYLTHDHLAFARTNDVDECIVHYADLPALLGPSFDELPDLDLMIRTKQWTRGALAHREDAGAADRLRSPSTRPERRRWPRATT